MSKTSPSIGSAFKTILAIAVSLAVLGSTVNSLTIYMGGDELGASAPATATTAILAWLLGVVMLSVVQTIILCVGLVIFSFGFVFAQKVVADMKPAHLATLRKLAGGALLLDVALSVLLACYNGAAHYAIFSALKADPTLNLVTAILTGVLTFVYSVPVIAFIGTVATIVFGTFWFVLSGGLSKGTKPSEAQTDSTNN